MFTISGILFPALAGHIYLTSAPSVRHQINSYNAASYGALVILSGLSLYILSASLIEFIFHTDKNTTLNGFVSLIWFEYVEGFVSQGSSEKPHTAIASFFALLLSVTMAVIMYLFEKKSLLWDSYNTEQEYSALKKHGGGPLENLIVMSRSDTFWEPLMITLKNKKVYIGVVTGVPPARKGIRRSLRLLPMQSGYYDDKWKYHKQTDYKVYHGIFAYIFKQKLVHSNEEISFFVEPTKKKSGKTQRSKKITLVPSKLVQSFDEGLVIDYEEILSVRLYNKPMAEIFEFKGQ